MLGDDGNIFLTGQDVIDYRNKETERNLILNSQKKSKENHIRFKKSIRFIKCLGGF